MTEHPPSRHLTIAEPPDDNTWQPPQDIPAERACLGGMIHDHTTIPDVLNTVTSPEFYRPAHELIYDAIEYLHNNGDPVDTITIAKQLGKHLPRAGGRAYLEQLALEGVAHADPAYYGHIVSERAALRRLAETGARIQTLGHAQGDTNIADLYQAAASELQAAAQWLPTTAATPTSWTPVDLAAIRANGLERPQATILTTSHGQGLIYPGRTHSISGESTTGKTWVTLAGLCQEIRAGHPVTFIDFEDRADSLITRLDDMGADPATVDRLVRYIGPDRALDTTSWRHVETAVKDCRLVVIDGVTEAMTMHGWSLLDNEDIARWYGLLPRRIATLGPGVIEIDHVVKDKEARGRYAIGGAHKLNGITGCAYNIHLTKSFAIGQQGSSRVVVAKDRHGNVGPVGHTAAEFHVTPDPSRHREAMVWELTPNQATYGTTGRPRLTGYMEKVSRFLETHPTEPSKRTIWASIRGKETHLTLAIETLLDEGWIRTEPGPRNATFHFSVKPYREDEDTHE